MSIISLHSNRFNNIIVYRLLKVEHCVYSPISLTRFYRKRKYSYFTENSSRIVIGYIIDTINGRIEHPVIDRSNLIFKRRIFDHILNEHKRRTIRTAMSTLYAKTKLPESVMRFICTFL